MLQNTRALKKSYALKTMADVKGKVLEKHMDGMLMIIDGQDVWTHFAGVLNASKLMAVNGAECFWVRRPKIFLR
jgi:UDP-N-acetylmuramoyl-L-alanyl-D-glutamate--2,6-diaminopimelate ligase